ncbi:MAG: TolC family protein [Nitrospiraceae bacterium]|nr:TolC family protein [Nitrospiraceae bacterium]
MKRLLTIITFLAFASCAAEGSACSADLKGSCTVSEVIAYALSHNPRIASAKKDTELGAYGIDAAKAERLPKINLGGGMTRYDLPTPVSPITGSPLAGVAFPEFDRVIYDIGASFTIPMYRGGRLDRGVEIAGLRKTIAEDMLRAYSQELVFNLTSVCFKILQLEKLLAANDETVRQLEAHKKNVELFLQAGTAPRLDLLKTETELAHARQSVILVKNGLDSAYDLLKTLMGTDDLSVSFSLVPENFPELSGINEKKSLETAFSKRPDYAGLLRRKKAAEEMLQVAEGARLPSVNLQGEYTDRSGSSVYFRPNWYLSLRFLFPVFDGGSIRTEIGRMKTEAGKVRDEERELRSRITREVRDALREIGNARERVAVTEAALVSATENVRVERLKYDAGSGTSTEVIDAEAALLRAETDHQQALYDRHIAGALLQKAIGEDTHENIYTGALP